MIDPVETWKLDDAWRRLSNKLFDDIHQTSKAIVCNELYRGALSKLFYGLAHDDKAIALDAAAEIACILNASS